MIKKIDEKHHIDVMTNGEIKIIKTTNGQAIPDEEPIILFRGRDKLALPMLRHYYNLCKEDGATEYQLDSVRVMIAKFAAFAESSPTMKQPGSTLGK